ncbi:MAG: matrixin family metalloprotease, partial [Nitrosomonas sp.]|nr:matrixin family metalloprotease [Nitrosomonas sp.]
GAQSSGQPPFEACKPGDFTVLGYPDEFGPRATPSFDVLIDKRFDGQFLTQQKIWLPVIVDAISKWNGVSGSKWRFNNLGMTDKEADPNDNRVTIAACGGLFACPEQGPPSPPRGPGGDILEFFPVFQTTVAVTLIYEDFSPGRAIRNSDIFFNPAIPFAVDPSPGQIDFETVLLHELGHSLGLDHNDNCVAGKTVMESLVGLNERKRALSSSELEGVRFLYPADTAASVRVKESERRVELKAVAGQYPPFPVDVSLYGLRFRRWNATASQPWVTLEPPTGRFHAAESIQIGVNHAGLPVGAHQATVSISDDKHAGPPATVTVALTVSEAGVRGDAPLLTSAGIVSAANPTSRRVAPGSLVTLYGQSFATETLAAEGFPLPTRLGSTEVIINGSKAPLLYVSPTQINALAPAETYAGRSGVIVRNSFGQNHGTAFDMTTAAPELFLLDARRAIALNQNGRLNGPNDPAAGGEVVTLYFTGQGATTPHVPSGHAAPSEPLARVAGAHRVLVAGREAKVHYLGLAPGFAGLAQANVEMPDGIFGELPVRIEIDGQLGEPGFVTVR